jgi:hypothetical protein
MPVRSVRAQQQQRALVARHPMYACVGTSCGAFTSGGGVRGSRSLVHTAHIAPPGKVPVGRSRSIDEGFVVTASTRARPHGRRVAFSFRHHQARAPGRPASLSSMF